MRPGAHSPHGLFRALPHIYPFWVERVHSAIGLETRRSTLPYRPFAKRTLRESALLSDSYLFEKAHRPGSRIIGTLRNDLMNPICHAGAGEVPFVPTWVPPLRW